MSFLKRIIEKPIIGQVSALLSASVIGQLLLLAASPLISRLYIPEDFGIYGVFLSIVSIAVAISSFRYELSIPNIKSDKNALHILFCCFFITLFISIISFIILAITKDSILNLLNANTIDNQLWLLPISILFIGIYRALNYFSIKENLFKKIAKTKLTQNCSNIIFQLSLGFYSYGSFGLIISHTVGQSAGTLSLLHNKKIIDFIQRKKFSLKRSKHLLFRYRNFPKYDVPAALIDTLSAQLPNILLVFLFGPAVAGAYVFSERVLGIPISMLAQSIGDVLFGHCRKTIAEYKISKLTKKSILSLFLIIIIPTLIISIWGSSIFSLVFGDNWRLAGEFSSWLIIALAVQFIYSPLSLILISLNGQKYNLVTHCIMLIMKGSALLIGYYYSDPLLAIQLYSINTVLVYSGAIAFIYLKACAHDKIRI
ncbi:lipopolysaccharide biosynthesis protein [Endozoicomonadaceae bacterium StTr2]